MKAYAIIIVLIVFCVNLSEPIFGKGNHIGERKQLDVDVSFSGISGQTTTSADGIQFCDLYGRCTHENKVYPSKYWGAYPLFYFGRMTGIAVTITNNGPRRNAKVTISTEAYVINTDGSNGIELKPPQEIDVELSRGETRTIDASFIVEYSPEIPSGLNRFLVKISHTNMGRGSGKNEPGLIMSKEGVFCPPTP